MNRLGKVLFVVHGVVTAAAGVVLIVAPGLIPGAVGIDLSADAALVPYLLGGMELGAAVLSIGATRLTDRPAIRLIALSFVVLHLVTAAVEVVAIAQGASPLVWGNVALRVIVAALFALVLRRREPRQAS
ncbi:MAG: hypothetical protein KF727_10085 [Microbacteriaceae bacterium]|nr:hypothetical protein [Microbacteriaceae bacterium]